MDPAVATGQVRVKVVGDSTAADIALPTSLTIRDLIPRIRATLDSGRDDDELPAPTDSDDDALQPYSLAAPGATPFSLNATLDALSIEDGELLLLRRLPPGPTAPPIVEDIADASAIHSASQFKPFTHSLLPNVTLVAVFGVGALVIGLSLAAWHADVRGWAAIALGTLTAAYVAATAVLTRRGHARAAAHLGLATTLPLALALAAALPGDGAAPRVFLAAAGVIAWSLLLLTLTNAWVSTYTALIVVSGAVAIAAAVRILAHLPYLSLGCGLIAISLVVALNAPTAAAVWARYPLPNIPAPDEITPPALDLKEIEDLPRKAANANAYQSGLIAASVVLAVIGSVLTLWIPDAPSLLAWWLVIATIAVTVLRMRIWDSAVPALWFLSAPFLTAASLSVTFAVKGHQMAAIYAAAALAGLTAVILLASLLKPRALTIPQRRYLDFFESTLLATIPPAVLVLVGIVSLIRNRGTL